MKQDYKSAYENVFRKLISESSTDYFYESAMLSYLHPNKLMSWLFWKRIEMALSLCEDLQGKSVLDFGCGGGVTFAFLKEQNCRIVGCEAYYYELTSRVCRELGIDAEICQDLSQIAGQKFDYILALDCLEHVDDLDKTIEKLLAMSHGKTHLILSGPTESLIYKLGRFLSGFSGHSHLRNIYEIEEKFKESQLALERVKNLYPPFPIFGISSWEAAARSGNS